MEDIKLRPGGLELTAIAAKAAALTKDSCVLDVASTGFSTDAIFSYGSVENYIREASACIDGCVLNCSISPGEAGYAYVLARKI